MLEVKIDKILPVTEAKDNFSNLVDEVENSDDLYVLTKNGKPGAVLVGIHHLEKLTGTSHEVLMGAVAGSASSLPEEDTAIEPILPQAETDMPKEDKLIEETAGSGTNFNSNPVLSGPNNAADLTAAAPIDLTNFLEDPVEENEPDPISDSTMINSAATIAQEEPPYQASSSSVAEDQSSSISASPFANDMSNGASEIAYAPLASEVPVSDNTAPASSDLSQSSTLNPSEPQAPTDDDPLDFLSNLDSNDVDPSASLDNVAPVNVPASQTPLASSSPLDEPLPNETPVAPFQAQQPINGQASQSQTPVPQQAPQSL